MELPCGCICHAIVGVKVHDTSIDLLVTDVGLPDVNGREVARLARLLRPNLKVLFITGYAEDAIFDGRDNDGSMEMLPKPFGVKALISAVNGLLPP
jgi:DNA-binding response OmpR family regulator